MATKKVAQNQSNTFAVLSFICSVLSWVVFGIILAPLGIVFGAVSLGKNESNRGLAIAGITIGGVALFVMIVALALWTTAVKML